MGSGKPTCGQCRSSFGPNDELDAALAGHVVTNPTDAVEPEHDKAEHQDLRHPQAVYVEIYVPVRDARDERMQAVIEFYIADARRRCAGRAGAR